MKRLIAGAVCLFLIACTGQNEIQPSQLTDREQWMVSSFADYFFLFDYHLKEDYQEIELWAEQWQNGELANEQPYLYTTQVDTKGSLLFSVTNDEEADSAEITIGTIESEGSGTASFVLDFPHDNVDYVLSENTFPEGEWNDEVVFAILGFDTSENFGDSVTISSFETPDQLQDELANYKEAFVFKGKLIK
ncbi:hypothetical protein [Gracilibacillus alcaliphilus]|uniref:hypothetical protein n=1 Tax=Gracilibacillus alcaliphilus TaxID=1401441 RepID=UPI00195E44A4|nr:hypothetical protein [Gracilibacillus alcaliphilus]MBM7676697.1 hypothetical protein [Gracilibacillus alcaliphilus]